MTPPGMRTTATTQRTNILMAAHRLHKLTRAQSLQVVLLPQPNNQNYNSLVQNEFRRDFALSTILEGTCRLEPHSMKERWLSARA